MYICVCVVGAMCVVCIYVFVLWVGVVRVYVCGQSAGPIRAAKLSLLKNLEKYGPGWLGLPAGPQIRLSLDSPPSHMLLRQAGLYISR